MTDRQLRQHVLELLDGGGAHLKFADAVAEMPLDRQGGRVDGVPYTPWGLLEHMRIAQWDILEFTRNPQHVSPPFPDGYWPADQAPRTPTGWQESIAAFEKDLADMRALVADQAVDLLAPIPHGDGQTVLREALLVADHNAYHLGQLVVLRRALGIWSD